MNSHQAAADESRRAELVGRGARDGARLFREWFGHLTEVAERGEGAAYVFVMGSFAEILRSFDMEVVFPEINALQTAVRRVSDDYLNVAEDYGYSPDVCAYVKADLAMHLQGGKHPMVTLPKPSLGVLTNACNTYIKWAEIWERVLQTELAIIDVPGSRAASGPSEPGSEDFVNERRYVVGQIEELIASCERLSGQKFDIDKLRQRLALTNRMSADWRHVVELNRSKPAVFNALTDGTIYLGMANCFRATPEGVQYFAELREEMSYRAENGIGTTALVDGQEVPAVQDFRLGFIGVPCYPIFRKFSELFSDWGGVFVPSAYLTFATGGADSGYQYDLERPIESFAESLLANVGNIMDQLFYQCPQIETAASDYDLDGIVYHPIKSCRTVSTGLADRRHHAAEDLGMATLFMESDMMDARVVSEAQMRNRIDAFFEGLIARRQQGAA